MADETFDAEAYLDRVAAQAAFDLGVAFEDRGDLVSAKAAYADAAAAAAANAHVAAMAAFNLGLLYERTDDLDGARRSYEQAASAGDTDVSPTAWFKLAGLARQRGDRDAARGHYERAIASALPELAARAAFNLASMEVDAGDDAGARAGYEQAIALGQAEWSSKAAFNLADLFARNGDRARARAAYRQAAGYRGTQAAAWAIQRLAHLDAEDGQVAGPGAGAAVGGVPSPPSELDVLAQRLADATRRWQLDSDAQTLDEALRLSAEILARPDLDSMPAWFRPALFNDHAGFWMARYLATGETENVVQAIDGFRSAIAFSPLGSEDLPQLHLNLATALTELYHHAGDPRDIEEVLDVLGNALRESGSGTAWYLPLLAAYGRALRELFELTGNFRDLDRAIEVQEEAGVRSVIEVPDDPERWQRHRDWAEALFTRYERQGDSKDLDAAIFSLEEALSLVTPGALGVKAQWGRALRARFHLRGDADDLERARRAASEAIEGAKRGNPDRAGYLTDLALCLLDRFALTGDASDVEAALSAQHEAVAATPRGSSARPARLAAFARALRAQYDLVPSAARLDAARDTYRRACQEGVIVEPDLALATAREWAEWAESRQSWVEAAAAYELCLDIASVSTQQQLVRPHKEAWLLDARGAATRGAYAGARAGELRGAAGLAERGRAVLLSQALRRERAQLETLIARGHGEAAERYGRAAQHVRAAQRTEDALADRRWDDIERRTATEDLQQATLELEAAIEEIRRLTGMGTFGDPPAFEEVVEAARDEPAVYLVPAAGGGVALVADPTSVRPVWLPRLSEDAVAARARSHEAARARRAHDPAAWRAALDETTSWLWDAVMGPVLGELSGRGALTLVPCGLLGLLPLHAAWTGFPAAGGARRFALDEATITYAPNLEAMREASRVAAAVPVERFLAVTSRVAAVGGELPFVGDEARLAAGRFPSSRVVDADEAAPPVVLDALAGADIAHFACHGLADLAEPLNSGLLLAGGERLTLAHLMVEQLAIRLAVLSACETALPGTELPDEAIGLPAGLLQAGAAGVLGALWSVPDAATMLVVVRFYDLWRGAGEAPAAALRTAQRWVRDTTNAEKAERFPEWGAQACEGMSAGARRLWEAARSHSHPYYWAAFAFYGR